MEGRRRKTTKARDLEEVPADNGEPLLVISHSFEILVATEHALEDVQEELERILIQEVDLGGGRREEADKRWASSPRGHQVLAGGGSS